MTFDPSLLHYSVNSTDEAYTGHSGAFSISATVDGTTATSTSITEIVAQQGAPGDTELTLFGSSPQIIFEFEALGPWSAGYINQPLVLDTVNSQQDVFVGSDSFSITPTAAAPAPEPAFALLLGSGLVALRMLRRRRRS